MGYGIWDMDYSQCFYIGMGYGIWTMDMGYGYGYGLWIWAMEYGIWTTVLKSFFLIFIIIYIYNCWVIYISTW